MLPAPLAALLALLLSAPTAAARPALLPPLVLPMASPHVTASIAGQTVLLRVDHGIDTDCVVLAPAAAARLQLALDSRPGGKPPARGVSSVQVGQTEARVPWSREQVSYAGINSQVRVMTPAKADFGTADGAVSPALLPHILVQLVARPATSNDLVTTLKAQTRGLFGADAIQASWPLPGGKLDVELHPHRQTSVASVSAAAILAQHADGRLTGPVHRTEIAYGVARPVRTLQLARAVTIAGARLSSLDVRIFDWSGSAVLPPDADGANEAEIVVKTGRGRQRGWPILRLGRDALAGCASITWQQAERLLSLTCPAGQDG